MSSTNTVTNNTAHLAQLKRQLSTIKTLHNIDACTKLEQRMALANQRKPLLDEIEQYELLVENDRITNTIQKFEEIHPPTMETCNLCHEDNNIRLGDWTKATIDSRGEPCRVLHCCCGIICNRCFDATVGKEENEATTVDDGDDDDDDGSGDTKKKDDTSSSCPLCHNVLPSVGSDEMKNQMIKNAQDGHAETQLNLGICLLGRGFLFGGPHPCDGFEPNKKQGLKWIKAAAKQNHPMALYMLGKAYMEGIDGTPLKKSPVDAFRSIELASKLGSSWAHSLLGGMYMAGRGVKQDKHQGVKHLTIAYGLGICIESSSKLGMMFSVGGIGGLEKNLVLAKHYLEEASIKHVVEDAYWPLGNVLLELTSEQYDGSFHIPGHSCVPQSLYWLGRAADDNGNTESRMKARAIEEGFEKFCTGCLKTAIGVPRDLESGNVPGSCKDVNDAKRLGTAVRHVRRVTGSVAIKLIVLIQRNSLKSSMPLIA